ncbi:hypothetical protein ANCDUO_18367 [Ancylostoma duodenale]|uniref:Uncharacterized protein n=1 Tax=Ancylostoma duodenale TaxID=51022 RepID=A0A0C2CP50_9BILA|nr:hypothetical protein ANCDUO_18367 [Ancylostoma duodenale]
MPSSTKKNEGKVATGRNASARVGNQDLDVASDSANNIPQDVVDAFSAIHRIVTSSFKSMTTPDTHARSASLPSQRQLDTKHKVTEILDMIGVEARPCTVVRLGNLTDGKTRLTKVAVLLGAE